LELNGVFALSFPCNQSPVVAFHKAGYADESRLWHQFKQSELDRRRRTAAGRPAGGGPGPALGVAPTGESARIALFRYSLE